MMDLDDLLAEEEFQDIEIEIGFGASPVITRIAERQSQTLFIGVDINAHWCDSAVDIAARLGLRNVYFLAMEAKRFLAEWPQAASISAIHIYFPSPGPPAMKAITPTSVSHMARLLRPQGSVRIVTDNTEYFSEIEHCFASDDWLPIKWRPPRYSIPAGRVVDTDCERKYGAKNRLHAIRRK